MAFWFAQEDPVKQMKIVIVNHGIKIEYIIIIQALSLAHKSCQIYVIISLTFICFSFCRV